MGQDAEGRVLSRLFEGKKLPPPKKRPSFHPKNIVITTAYIKVTISEKSSRRDEVSAHTVTFLKIVSQNAPDCISVHIHFKKFLEEDAPGSPRKLVAFSHSGLLPQMINPR